MRVGNIRYRGGSADVSEGKYLGRRVAIKHIRFRVEDGFNKGFKVLKSQSTQPIIITYYSFYIQRFCWEIIGWKRLSHPNILPLLGVYVSTNPQDLCIVSDWMQRGDVMTYARAKPEANRLRLVSSSTIFLRIPILFLQPSAL